jgi:hypothetical protein
MHIFAPFNDGTVATGSTVGKTARGYCWEGSIADDRADAWRCFLGNYILDPCFSNGASFRRFVLCAPSPWSRLVKLRLTKRLPLALGNHVRGRPTEHPPWAIKLAGGLRCVAVTGATSAIAGLGLDYSCSNGGLLAGRPHRKARSWTIFYARGYQAHALSTRHVAQAWW